MSNVYRFIYDSEVSPDSTDYAEATTVKTRHYFTDGTTWPVILYQFCKFLESTGYEGVREKVVIKDKYGFHKDSGFETIGPEEDDDFIFEALDNQDKDAD